MRTGSGAAAGRWTVRLYLAAALLGAVVPRVGVAQPAAPAEAGSSAQDLRAALDEIKRRVEEQRRAAGTAPAGAAADDLDAARDRIESLARTMLQLRADRDDLRARLVQARDELA